MANAVSIQAPTQRKPFHGEGYLAGTYPSGVTTVDGVPQPVEVRVIWRGETDHRSDGVVVKKTMSAPDGTWRIDGLDDSLRYDVIGRKGGFNDVIVSDVAPSNPLRLPASVGSAYVGEPFSVTLPIKGGSGPVTAVLVGGTLPGGISYADGILSGAWPTGAAGVYTLTFDLTDSSTTVSASTSITLAVRPLAIVGGFSQILLVGEEIEPYQFTAQGGEAPYTFSVSSGSLPTGISLNSSGLLSGVASALGSYSAIIAVTDIRGSTASISFGVDVGGSTPHKYWRVYITDTNGGGYGSICELEFLDYHGVRAPLSGGSPVASSSLSGHEAYRAFDGIIDSSGGVWAPSSASPPMWLGYSHASPVEVSSVRITAREIAHSSQAAKNFEIQHSDDGVVWTTVMSVANQTGWGNFEQRTFALP